MPLGRECAISLRCCKIFFACLFALRLLGTLGVRARPKAEDFATSVRSTPTSSVVGLVGVGILSRSNHFAQRQLLRDSWFHLESIRAGLVLPRFFVAEPADVGMRQKLAAEHSLHGDLELLVGRPEAYDAVPHQTLAMLLHFSQNSSVLWIIKTDDDVFLRADAARQALLATSRLFPTVARIYSGWMVKGAKAHRNGKWAVTHAEYADEYYPEYASGPTYALTSALARQIIKLHNTTGAPWIRLEDVAMGMWVAAVETSVRVHRRDDRRFYKGRFCVEWSVAVLLEQGRPLFFQAQDVRKAMLELYRRDMQHALQHRPQEQEWRDTDTNDTHLPTLHCPQGTRVEDAQARVACQQHAADPDDIATCAPWLEAARLGSAQQDAGGQDGRERPPGSGVLDSKDFLGNLFPGGPASLQRKAEGAVIQEALQVCEVPCSFIIDGTGGHIVGDVGVYLGDLEVYRKDPGMRQVPALGGGGSEMRAVVFREAESKFPAAAWAKYEVNITYSLGAHVTYGYLDDLPLLLQDAALSSIRPEHRPDLLGAVVLRCGDKGGGGGGGGSGGRSTDRRRMRAKFVEDLSRILPVKSYGECARNSEWPPGLERDKLASMRRARFCLAYENSVDEDYVTEKLFDCLRAGAIPIVSGGRHVREFAPPASSIFVEDYASVHELAAHVRRVDGDAAAYAAHRRWMDEHEMPGWHAWRARMLQIQASDVRCRLCRFIARKKRGHAFTESSEEMLTPEGARFQRDAEASRSREAASIAAAEQVRRRALSDKRRVSVEL